MPAMTSQRRALDFGAEERRHRHQQQAHQKHDQRQPSDRAWRQQRRGEQDQDGRHEIHQVPVDEVEGIEIEPRRHRRTGRKREHHAGQHQREHRSEDGPVHRPPPFAERRAMRARNHAL
jgi:hypothetical protein